MLTNVCFLPLSVHIGSTSSLPNRSLQTHIDLEEAPLSLARGDLSGRGRGYLNYTGYLLALCLPAFSVSEIVSLQISFFTAFGLRRSSPDRCPCYHHWSTPIFFLRSDDLNSSSLQPSICFSYLFSWAAPCSPFVSGFARDLRGIYNK